MPASMRSTEAQGPTAVGRVRQSSIVSDGDVPPRGRRSRFAKGLRGSLSRTLETRETPHWQWFSATGPEGLEPSTPGFGGLQRTSRASGGGTPPRCDEGAWDSLRALRFRQSRGRRRSHRTARDVGKARARAHEDRLQTQGSRTSSSRFSWLQDAQGAVSFQARARPPLR